MHSRKLISLLRRLLGKQKFGLAEFVICLLLLGAYYYFSKAEQISGAVLHVADGDSFTTKTPSFEQKNRLYGVDTPEYSQPYGKKAKEFTEKALYNKEPEFKNMGMDQYGRNLVIVILPDGTTLNEALITQGLAMVYTAYCSATPCDYWKKLEAKAKQDKQGLWLQKNPIPPWVWRTKNR